MEGLTLTLVIAVAVVIFFVTFFTFVPVGLWISAISAGVQVKLLSLVAMRLRRVSPHQIILPLIKADKAGIAVTQDGLEAHYLAGGDVDRVVDALIAADKARIALPFDRAVAIDLAGCDVLEAVKVSVNPQVIQTPEVSAVLWFSDDPIEDTMPSPTRAMIVSSPAPPTNRSRLARTVTRALQMS